MTNYEKINSINQDELAEWLKTNNDVCDNYMHLSNIHPALKPFCMLCLEGWLKSKVNTPTENTCRMFSRYRIKKEQCNGL